MLQKGLLRKAGGGLSLVSLLFLPIGGCQGMTVTGFEVIRANDVGADIKLLLVISVLCAIGAFLFKKVPELYYAGGGGIGGLLGAYTVTRQSFPVQLKIGAFLAIIGFGLILAEGFLLTQKAKETVSQGTGGGNIKKEPPDNPPSDSLDKLE